jgi:hypothetical protein
MPVRAAYDTLRFRRIDFAVPRYPAHPLHRIRLADVRRAERQGVQGQPFVPLPLCESIALLKKQLDHFHFRLAGCLVPSVVMGHR